MCLHSKVAQILPLSGSTLTFDLQREETRLFFYPDFVEKEDITVASKCCMDLILAAKTCESLHIVALRLSLGLPQHPHAICRISAVGRCKFCSRQACRVVAWTCP
ncbi:hypothetical protein V6N13_053162 [Hibiscus sabdariffa]